MRSIVSSLIFSGKKRCRKNQGRQVGASQALCKARTEISCDFMLAMALTAAREAASVVK
jgi:hypothetical protein